MASWAIRCAVRVHPHKRRLLSVTPAVACIQLRCIGRTTYAGSGQQLQRRLKSTFDVRTVNQVARPPAHGGSGGGDSTSAATAWHLGGAITRFDRRFDVFEVSKSGGIRRTSVTLAEVMAEFGVHARDLLSLGLQDERYHPPPAVLPRDGVVVVALGPFKALLHTEACLIFEAGKVDMAHIAPVVAELMRANAKDPHAKGRPGSQSMSPLSSQSNAAELQGSMPSGGAGAETLTPDSLSSKSTAENDASTSAPTAGVCELGQTGIASSPRGPDGNDSVAGKSDSHSPATSLGIASKTPSAITDSDLGKKEGTFCEALSQSEAVAEGHQRPKAPQEADHGEGLGSNLGEVKAGAEREGNDSTPASEYAKSSTADQEYARVLSAIDAPLSAVDRLKLAFGVGAKGHAGGGGAAEGAEGGWTKGREHPMKTMFSEQTPMPFELAMLEAMLQEVCAGYHRRTHVVRRLMERGLMPEETSSLFAPNRIDYYRVVPLKLALKQLELKLSQTRACLEELMHSDEDMLGLLLTEIKELGKGEVLDPHRHSVVELLLENYHRQLVLVGHDVAAMREEMESMQELAAISLDVSRNSMIAVDIRLAMLNVGIACSACVYGALGMNLVSGLEGSNAAFLGVVGGSVAFSALTLAGVMRHLRSVAKSGDSQQGQLMALNSICDHVDDIESVLRTELEQSTMVDDTRPISAGTAGADSEQGSIERGSSSSSSSSDGDSSKSRKSPTRVMIDRESMARKLSRTRGKEISKHELDLIFTIFDTTGDGSIDTHEYGKLVTDAAGSLGKGTTGDSNF